MVVGSYRSSRRVEGGHPDPASAATERVADPASAAAGSSRSRLDCLLPNTASTSSPHRWRLPASTPISVPPPTVDTKPRVAEPVYPNTSTLAALIPSIPIVALPPRVSTGFFFCFLDFTHRPLYIDKSPYQYNQKVVMAWPAVTDENLDRHFRLGVLCYCVIARYSIWISIQHFKNSSRDHHSAISKSIGHNFDPLDSFAWIEN